jgi:hypothetical protein
MAYTEAARERRRCTGTRKDGKRCGAWAVWDDPRQLCMSHAGRHHRGRMASTDGGPYALHRRTNYPNCKCHAYQWPHRPGGGLCRWPDPPIRMLIIHGADRHSTPRCRGIRARLHYAARGGIEPGNWRRF